MSALPIHCYINKLETSFHFKSEVLPRGKYSLHMFKGHINLHIKGLLNTWDKLNHNKGLYIAINYKLRNVITHKCQLWFYI